MARIRVTAYECERDLLPPICAKCGKPAADRVVRPARNIKDDRMNWIRPLASLCLPIIPSLGFYLLRQCDHEMLVRVPMCNDHSSDFAWRDDLFRNWVVPIWTTVALILELAGLVNFCYLGHGRVFLYGVMIASVLGILVEKGIWCTGVRLTAQLNGVAVWLNGVHPDFVAALVEDRARSRIDDPNRRVDGDMKHDYDDEMN